MESLKELREKAGKSMRLTAEDLGIPYTTYVSYEKGTREPNSEMLVKIAEYYHTTTDFLLGRLARNSMAAPTIGERIRDAREARKMSQEELGRACKTTKQTIYKYESGLVTNIPLDRLEAIADALGVSSAYLAGWDTMPSAAPNMISVPAMARVPLVGAIACGTPTLAEQNIEGCVDMPGHTRADFALRCKGDSMINARIYDGDIVYIRQQEEVEHGEIAAVLIEDAATLKRVYLYDDHISLEAENPQYRPLVYWGEAMNGIRILGKAIAFTSAVR